MSVNRLSISTQAHWTDGLSCSLDLSGQTLATDSETNVSMMSQDISRTKSTSALALRDPDGVGGLRKKTLGTCSSRVDLPERNHGIDMEPAARQRGRKVLC